MFYDQSTIKIKAGDGGNGLVSLRHNRETAFGGPDGGNGGNGGSIFFVADSNINTLANYVRSKNFKAENGQSGGKNDCHGKKGEDLILKVPVGTVVFNANNGKKIVDLKENGEKQLIAKGGKGGFGNAHFKTSRRQTPDFAELGEPGQEFELNLELKLVADVGIIGLPNAGKSTLISVISASKPKIADYPFTTIVPNLGVVKVGDFSFVACDIPGLIEGSGKGRGLGDEFLRHVERCRILVHLIDATSADLINDYKTINSELKIYSKELAKKTQIVVVSKWDTVGAESRELRVEKTKKEAKITKINYISAVSGEGIKELLYEIVKILKKQPKKRAEKIELPVYRPQENFLTNITIEKDGKELRVVGKKLEEIVSKTNFKHEVGQARLEKVFNKSKLYEKLGNVKEGTIVKIGARIAKYSGGKIRVVQ